MIVIEIIVGILAGLFVVATAIKYVKDIKNKKSCNLEYGCSRVEDMKREFQRLKR